MELYVLSKQDLSILSICKLSDWQINLDEETNAKSTFSLIKTDGLMKDNFLVLNGLYKQFLFIIDEVQTEKGSNLSTVTALDISNIFDRKVIEKNIDDMKNESIEKFLAETISDNFVNSDDTYLNVGYIDIYWHTNTQGTVATNAENGLYNFHTFLINCRQYKNIYTDFQFVDGRLRIDIQYKEETTKLIDTTLPEVTDYNKIYENDITAKVTVFIRENGSEYNLYLKTDRTTTTNKDDPDRANGRIEVISVDTEDRAAEEALNVMKGNNYKHLVEFKIAKTSKTMDISEFTIGRPVRIKTEDDIYDSYISAITLSDENFVYFKSGSLRNTLIDKLKSNENKVGNKLDVSGGKITGPLQINGTLNGNYANFARDAKWNTYSQGNVNYNNFKQSGHYYLSTNCTNAPDGLSYVRLIVNGASDSTDITQIAMPVSYNRIYIRTCANNTWTSWQRVTTLDSTYPVGSIYMSVNSTNPSQLFGGTWQQIKNVFLLGAGDTYTAGSTGGSRRLDMGGLIHYASGGFGLQQGSGSYSDRQITGVYGRVGNDEQDYSPLNNISLPLPPYLAVYMWKRIS